MRRRRDRSPVAAARISVKKQVRGHIRQNNETGHNCPIAASVCVFVRTSLLVWTRLGSTASQQARISPRCGHQRGRAVARALVCVCIYTCLCTHVCIRACTCVCTRVYVFVYTHAHLPLTEISSCTSTLPVFMPSETTSRFSALSTSCKRLGAMLRKSERLLIG